MANLQSQFDILAKATAKNYSSIQELKNSTSLYTSETNVDVYGVNYTQLMDGNDKRTQKYIEQGFKLSNDDKPIEIYGKPKDSSGRFIGFIDVTNGVNMYICDDGEIRQIGDNYKIPYPGYISEIIFNKESGINNTIKYIYKDTNPSNAGGEDTVKFKFTMLENDGIRSINYSSSTSRDNNGIEDINNPMYVSGGVAYNSSDKDYYVYITKNSNLDYYYKVDSITDGENTCYIIHTDNNVKYIHGVINDYIVTKLNEMSLKFNTLRKIYITDYALSVVNKSEDYTPYNFSNKLNLYAAIIENGSIPDECFKGCIELQYVSLKKGVTLIGVLAFEGCNILNDDIISSDMSDKIIQFEVYHDSNSLKKVSVRSNEIDINLTEEFDFKGDEITITIKLYDLNGYTDKEGYAKLISNIIYTNDKNNVIIKVIYYGSNGEEIQTYYIEHVIKPPEPGINVDYMDEATRVNRTISSTKDTDGNIIGAEFEDSTGIEGYYPGYDSTYGYYVTKAKDTNENPDISKSQWLYIDNDKLSSVSNGEDGTLLGEKFASTLKELVIYSSKENNDDMKYGLIAIQSNDKIINNFVQLTEINVLENISRLPNYSFAGCGKLINITLPTTLTCISQKAFAGCDEIKTIDLPTSVGEIGDGCFNNCSNLESFGYKYGTIYNSSNPCFTECYKINTLVLKDVSDDIKNYESLDNLKNNLNQKDGIFKRLNGDVGIDDGYGNKTLTINNAELYDDKDIYIYIPHGNVISDWFIYRGEKLYFIYKFDEKELIVRDESGKKFTGGTFYFTEDNKSYTINPFLTRIQPYWLWIKTHECFTSYKGNANTGYLSRIIIENSITQIVDNIFNNKITLQSIETPNSVTEIAAQCFSGCTVLTSIKLPENPKFTTLNQGLFVGCSSLKEIIIPENVNTLGLFEDGQEKKGDSIKGVFNSCKALENIYINGKIENIASNTFESCNDGDDTRIINIYLRNSEYNMSNDAFKNAAFKNLLSYSDDSNYPKYKFILPNGNEITIPSTE